MQCWISRGRRTSDAGGGRELVMVMVVVLEVIKSCCSRLQMDRVIQIYKMGTQKSSKYDLATTRGAYGMMGKHQPWITFPGGDVMAALIDDPGPPQLQTSHACCRWWCVWSVVLKVPLEF